MGCIKGKKYICVILQNINHSHFPYNIMIRILKNVSTFLLTVNRTLEQYFALYTTHSAFLKIVLITLNQFI
jgi:hypothetical protein